MADGGDHPIGGDRGSRPPDAPPGTGVRPPGSGRPRATSDRYGHERYAANAPSPSYDKRSGVPQHAPSAGRLPARRRRHPGRWIAFLLLLVLVVYPATVLAVAWTSLNRVDAVGESTPGTPGRTYLVVGSDSRQGLTPEQRKQLHTGRAGGGRTDTILLLHVPAGRGPTVLMSVPRDSYVAIPGHGHNKINAAYAFGGPRLLADTLEKATGVQIDDYVEIGLGGFAGMVDAVGGVQICPTFDMRDSDAGLNVKKGCQHADGATALAYARARHSDPRGDLGRVERQRELLAAIVTKATKPTTLVNPFRTYPLAHRGAGALTVDDDTGPFALLRFVLGMRSAAGSTGLSLTVPVSGTSTRPGVGAIVLWNDAQAQQVFDALRTDDTEQVRSIADKQKALR
ncbi:MAG TPA: LCP family protein [Actinomycetales bacterium]|nr:LCP family protein [Actinomycetales bacterium]